MNQTTETITRLHELECSECGQPHSAHQLQLVSECHGMPLVATYDLREHLSRATAINSADASMWRYRALLPLFDDENKVTLGEGFTPLLPLRTLGNRYNLRDLLLKDEGQNPTGSFKARGLSMAVSKAKELGATGCIIPTAGNAGVAMAAYCARAGLRAVVAMPRHTPQAFQEECYWYGAEVQLIDGLINDCISVSRSMHQPSTRAEKLRRKTVLVPLSPSPVDSPVAMPSPRPTSRSSYTPRSSQVPRIGRASSSRTAGSVSPRARVRSAVTSARGRPAGTTKSVSWIRCSSPEVML